MNIIKLKERRNIFEDIKLRRTYVKFRLILKELEKKELNHKIIESINLDIDELNSDSLTEKEFIKLVKQKQTKILKVLEKELKIVPQNYFLKLWMSNGMAVFGLPVGIGLGLVFGNIGVFGIGLPVGMAIGVLVGWRLDKKAAEGGRQLKIEM